MKPGTEDTFSSPRSAGPRVTASSVRYIVRSGIRPVVGDHVHDHDGDVVLAAAPQGRLHEGVRRRLGTVGPQEHLFDLLVGHHPAQTVAAEQKSIARLQTDLQKVGRGIAVGPQGPGDHATVRMDSRLGGGQLTPAHHLAHPGVVVCQLPEGSLAQQVCPRISHVPQDHRAVIEKGRREGSAHAEKTGLGDAASRYGAVGVDNGVAQFVLTRGTGGESDQPLAGHLGSHFAAARPAHAVADDVEAFADQEGVLVGLPDQSAVASESGRESHQRASTLKMVSPTSTRSPGDNSVG